MSFRLDTKLKSNLEYFAKEKAKSLAKEAEQRLTDKYKDLIDWYYAGYMPGLNNYRDPYYERKWRLYNSAFPYYKNSGQYRIYGGVEITGEKLGTYPSLDGNGFSGQDLLDKFIYTGSGTYHGGDWHGGYGDSASFSIYDELNKFRDQLQNEFESRCHS